MAVDPTAITVTRKFGMSLWASITISVKGTIRMKNKIETALIVDTFFM